MGIWMCRFCWEYGCTNLAPQWQLCFFLFNDNEYTYDGHNDIAFVIIKGRLHPPLIRTLTHPFLSSLRISNLIFLRSQSSQYSVDLVSSILSHITIIYQVQKWSLPLLLSSSSSVLYWELKQHPSYKEASKPSLLVSHEPSLISFYTKYSIYLTFFKIRCSSPFKQHPRC